MKKVVLIVFSFLLSSNVTAANWIVINKGANETLYLDADSLQARDIKNRQSVGAWIKNVYKKPQYNAALGKNKPFKEFKAMQWHQCATRSMSESVEMVIYDQKGVVLDSLSQNMLSISFNNVVPDTVESTLHDVVCTTRLIERINQISENGDVSDSSINALLAEYPNQIKFLDYDDSE